MPYKPLFSVIIPSYRSEATVGEAIQSVLDQDDVDFEIVVVVDGSPEDDHAAALAVASGDPRVKVISTKNGGVSAARNRGVEESSGLLLAFLDADDKLLPGALAAHATAFAADRTLDASYGRVRFWNPQQTDEGRVSAYAEQLPLPLILGDNQVCTASNVTITRRAFLEVGGFESQLRRAEDQDLLARLYFAGKKIRGINRLTVQYRTSSDGLSSDLECFEASWINMVQRLRFEHNGAINMHIAEIDARFQRYTIRRRIRLGQAGLRDAVRLSRLISLCPQLLQREPKRTLLTLLGATVSPLFRIPLIAATLSR